MTVTYIATLEDFSLRCVQLLPVLAHPLGDVIHADEEGLLPLLGCQRTAVTVDMHVIGIDLRLQTMTLNYVRPVDGVEREKEWLENQFLRLTELDQALGPAMTAEANVLCSVGQVGMAYIPVSTVHCMDAFVKLRGDVIA